MFAVELLTNVAHVHVQSVDVERLRASERAAHDQLATVQAQLRTLHSHTVTLETQRAAAQQALVLSHAVRALWIRRGHSDKRTQQLEQLQVAAEARESALRAQLDAAEQERCEAQAKYEQELKMRTHLKQLVSFIRDQIASDSGLGAGVSSSLLGMVSPVAVGLGKAKAAPRSALAQSLRERIELELEELRDMLQSPHLSTAVLARIEVSALCVPSH